MARIWFITGSSRGLGRALAEAVLQSGDSVVATARKPEQLASLVDKYGPERVLTLMLDVGDELNVNNAVKQAEAKFGRIDVAVNNAGYAETAALEDVTTDSFRRQLDANFLGAVYVSRAVLPGMRRRGSGHIIQVSSVGGRVGSPGLGAYQSAKWALSGFSTVLAQEVAPLGVKVTVIEPGAMKTDWAGSSMGQVPISEPYQQTVGAFKTWREQNIGTGGTDPEAVSRVIIHISSVEEPPVRLLVGPETPQWARQASESLAAADAKWHDVTTLSGI